MASLSTTTLRWLVLGLLAGTPLLANNYVKITRTTLPQCQASVVTCEPHGWLTRSSAVTSTSTSTAIGVREIVYLPSALSIYPEDADADGEGALDDHHFVSLLADRGFTVHVLRPNLDHSPASTTASTDPTTALHLMYLEALTQFVSLRVRTHRVPASCLCLLADELAAPRLLAYLADVALPMASTTRANIGAAVLIDPPPLLPLHTLAGRRRLLKSRYATPMVSPAAHRRFVAPHISQRAAVAMWKSTFRGLHGDGTGRVAQALLALLRSDPPTPSLSPFSVDDEEEEAVDTSTSSQPPPPPPPPPAETATAVEEMLLAEELRMLVRDTLTDAIDPWAHRLRTLRSRTRPGSTRLPLTAMGGDTTPTLTGGSRLSVEALPVEALAGPCPRHARAVGEAMRNRLLVLSTLDDPPPTPGDDRMHPALLFGHDDDGGFFVGEEEGGVDEADEWGYAAAEEAARLYAAGPVIDLSGDADEDDDEDKEDDDADGNNEEANGGQGLIAGFDAMTWRDLEHDLVAHPRKAKKKKKPPSDDGNEEGGRVLSKKQHMKLRSPSYLRLLQEKEAAAVATAPAPPAVTWLAEPTDADTRDADKDDDGADDGEEGKWQEGARRRHRRIARAVADWLDMLPVFGYLP